jgi:hypothetical protein
MNKVDFSVFGIDSLDVVEMIMFLEETFGVTVSEEDAQGFGSKRAIVDWLEAHLAGKRPGKKAVAVLKRVAETEARPELISDLRGPWRRDQVAAIIRTMFKNDAD